MNSPADFAELKLPERKKRDVALMLGLWNSADHEKGTVHCPPYMYMPGRGSTFRRRVNRLAKLMGLKVV